VPKLAPFFLPTQSNEQGFTFRTSEAAKNNDLSDSKFKPVAVNLFLSEFATKLENSKKMEDCKLQMEIWENWFILIINYFFCNFQT